MISRKLANQKSRTRLRTQMDFKGINIETKLKLKIMAANRGVPLYQLLDEIVEQAFKRNSTLPQGLESPAKFARKCESCSRLRCEPLVHYANECYVVRISDRSLSVRRYDFRLDSRGSWYAVPTSTIDFKAARAILWHFSFKNAQISANNHIFLAKHYTKEQNVENSIA